MVSPSPFIRGHNILWQIKYMVPDTKIVTITPITEPTVLVACGAGSSVGSKMGRQYSYIMKNNCRVKIVFKKRACKQSEKLMKTTYKHFSFL